MHLITTALAASTMTLVLVVLTINTIRMRMKHSAAFGDAGQHDLTSAIRAHGNFTEYAPIGLILIGLFENFGAQDLALGIVATLFVLVRTSNAIGLYNPPGPPTIARSIDAVGTVLLLAGMATWLLVLVHMPH